MPHLDPEIQRVLRHLKDVIEDSDLSRREVEQRAKFSPGYLTQLLTGRIDLKYWHLVAVLGAVRARPSAFFFRLFPPRRRRVAPSEEQRTTWRTKRPVPARGTGTASREQPGPVRTPQSSSTEGDAGEAKVYSFRLDSVRQLRQRLERCEAILRDLQESGLLGSES